MEKVLLSVGTSLFVLSGNSTALELFLDLKYAMLFIVVSLLGSRFNMLSKSKEKATIRTRIENAQDILGTLCFSFGATIALQVFLNIGVITAITKQKYTEITYLQACKLFFFLLLYAFCKTALKNSGVLATFKPALSFLGKYIKIGKKG